MDSEMMDRFATMKKNLLAIRKDQLDNNTRLTTLQNSQLVDELSYQSMNTAKVVLKNL